MKHQFRPYRARNIAFLEHLASEAWTVKLYTISVQESFVAKDFLIYVKAQIPQLLAAAADHHDQAFLVVHEATDGIWTLVNWWTGGEMLRTQTYFTPSEASNQLELLPNVGSMSCVWEMAVIQHERKAWIQHILQATPKPHIERYNQDIIEGWV